MNKENQDKKFFEELTVVRKSNNIDLHDISDKTKINIKYLKLIEKGDFDALPNIYVRLFIKSYAEYLGADPKLTLLEYDRFTNTSPKKLFKKKIKKKPQIDSAIKPQIMISNPIDNNKNEKEDTTLEKVSHSESKEKNTSNVRTKPSLNIKTKEILYNNTRKVENNDSITQQYFFSPTNILKVFITFSFISSIYLIISFLSKEQAVSIRALNNEEIYEPTNDIINYPVVDNILLSSNNFSKDKFINKKNFKIRHRINSPYIFQIVTKEKTKIYISHDNDDGLRIEDCNKIVSKDSLLKFEHKNNIYFDLWNAQHVEISINNKPISKYLGNDEYLIRGSFEKKNKNLHLEFYSH